MGNHFQVLWEYMGNIVQVVTGLLGVIIGWMLNEFSTKRREKPKLCFNLISTPDTELTEKELRTKTSSSDYSIEIYNVGQNPYILERIALFYEKKLLVDCPIDGQYNTIMPYKRLLYTFMEQDANALEHHCRKEHFKHCTVFAYDIEGTCYKAKLDVALIYFRTKLSPEEMIVIDDY